MGRRGLKVGVLMGVCGPRGFLFLGVFPRGYLNRFLLGVLGETSGSVDSDIFLALTFKTGELWAEQRFERKRECVVKSCESMSGYFDVGSN